MNITPQNQVNFQAKVLFSEEVIPRISKKINMGNVQRRFADATKGFKTDMIIDNLGADCGRIGSVFGLNLEKIADENKFVDKLLRTYKIIFSERYLKNAIAKKDGNNAGYFVKQMKSLAEGNRDLTAEVKEILKLNKDDLTRLHVNI